MKTKKYRKQKRKTRRRKNKTGGSPVPPHIKKRHPGLFKSKSPSKKNTEYCKKCTKICSQNDSISKSSSKRWAVQRKSPARGRQGSNLQIHSVTQSVTQ